MAHTYVSPATISLARNPAHIPVYKIPQSTNFLKCSMPTFSVQRTQVHAGKQHSDAIDLALHHQFNPFRTAAPFWGYTIQIISSLSPKQDCGPKRGKNKFQGPLLRWGIAIFSPIPFSPTAELLHQQATQYPHWCIRCVFVAVFGRNSSGTYPPPNLED